MTKTRPPFWDIVNFTKVSSDLTITKNFKQNKYMGFIRNAIVGIAIFEGIKYLIKNSSGITSFDTLKERAIDTINQANSVREPDSAPTKG